ncbi:MAG: exosortase C-terminal domain/associated protein EpsI [Verrucomicrobiota bacterium]
MSPASRTFSSRLPGLGSFPVFALVIALLLFTVMAFADAWVAVPMRAWSSQIAYWFLKAFGLPFEIHGAILTTPDFVFEVVPACSGSATLRVLLFLGILWFSVQPKWTMRRRLFGVFLALPLAVLVNAVRLTWLAGMGHVRGEALTGLAHDWSGLIAFTLGALGLIGISWLLRHPSSARQSKQQSSRHAIAVAALALSFIAYLPFFDWVGRGWRDSPLDRLGWIYTGLGLLGLAGGAAWTSWKQPDREKSKPTVTRALWMGVGGMVVFYVIALIADIRVLYTGSMACWAWSLLVLRYSLRTSLRLAPWIGLAVVGVPTVPYILNTLLSATTGMAGTLLTGRSAQLGVALVCLAGGALLFWWQVKGKRPPQPPISLRTSTGSVLAAGLLLLALSGMIAFRTYYQESGSAEGRASRLELSFQLADWQGRSLPLPNPLEGWEQGRNYWSRTYQRTPLESVGVLIASSEGNRHNLHPPEYCFTGSGWQIADRQAIEGPVGSQGQDAAITRIRVRRGQESLAGLYWYSDGETIYPDYQAVIFEDMKRRFLGQSTVWYFFRLLGRDARSLEQEFLPRFQPKVGPAATS